MPADGGPAVQVTRGGGFDAQESWDGRYLYYSKQRSDPIFSVGPGVWRVPVSGGEETPVVRASSQFWALSRAGIYWPTQSRGWSPDHTIQFFDFESGRTETLFRSKGPFTGLWLAVSPDEKWLLYTTKPMAQSELMLVENFR
jgi:hypothetical protein